MVEEYQQAVSVGNLGGIRDVQGLYPQLGLINSPQVLILQFRKFLLESNADTIYIMFNSFCFEIWCVMLSVERKLKLYCEVVF